MKKIFILPVILTLALANTFALPANAGFFDNYKAKFSQSRELKNARNDVKDVFIQQDEYTNSHNLDKLSSLYAEKFINADGFAKKIYFKLINDTWKTYPDIIYKTEIKDIHIDGSFATVQTYETALATTHEESESVDAYGELRSEANSLYYLQKFGSKWLIVAEQVLDEKSQLKYGDARFIKMDLSAPKIVNAGDEYTATLDIDLLDDENAIASIENQEIIHPIGKPEERFRNITDQNELERVFKANVKNINEYATASVGIAKTEPYDANHSKVYVTGIAFLMTRVNVIPQNKFITPEEDVKNAQETK